MKKFVQKNGMSLMASSILVFICLWVIILYSFSLNTEKHQLSIQLKSFTEIESNYLSNQINLCKESFEDFGTQISNNNYQINSEELVRAIATEKESAQYSDLYLVSPNNELLYANETNGLAAPEAFNHALVSDIEITSMSSHNEKKYICMLMPITISENEKYILAGQISNDFLFSAIKDAKQSPFSSFILNSSGQLVATRRGGGDLSIKNNISEALDIDVSSFLSNDENSIYVDGTQAVSIPLGVGSWYLVSVITKKSIAKIPKSILGFNIFGMLILAIALLYAGFLAKKYILSRESQLYSAMEEIKLSEESFKIAVSHQAHIVYTIDVLDNKLKVLSDKNLEIFDALESNPRKWFDIIHLEDIDDELRIHNYVKAGRKVNPHNVRIKCLNDSEEYIWYREILTGLKNGMGNVVRVIATVEDVNDEQLGIINLQNRAERDSLTKLYNRAACELRINDLLSSFSDSSGAVFMIMDIDKFKNINDSFGHTCGDVALKHLSQKLKSTFRETDPIGRLGGDEFIVWLKAVHDDDIIYRKISELNSALNEKYFDADNLQRVVVSVGATYVKKGDSFKDLYLRADKAMYRAKKQSIENKCVIYKHDQE